MAEEQLKDKEILITGGTSGLGLELVRLFLQIGYRVVSTGRQQLKLHGFEDRFTFYNVDFSDLGQVAEVLAELILKDKIENGAVYDILKRQRSLPEMDSSQKVAFMNACYSFIDPFLV
jgi:NAD(P)-dependent dehydrogenase (short-subunit alcohol dehydrogenase family)